MVTDTEQTSRMYVRSGTDTIGALFENSPVLYHKKMVINSKASPQTATIYKLTSHGLDTLLPINLKRIIFNNDSTISYDLKLCTDGFDVGAVYDIDALIEYGDGSHRWIAASIFGKSFSEMVISNTMIKKVSAEDTAADNDLGVLAVNGTYLAYNEGSAFEQFTLLIRKNVTGQAY
jgi:hypothetical protein